MTKTVTGVVTTCRNVLTDIDVFGGKRYRSCEMCIRIDKDAQEVPFSAGEFIDQDVQVTCAVLDNNIYHRCDNMPETESVRRDSFGGWRILSIHPDGEGFWWGKSFIHCPYCGKKLD